MKKRLGWVAERFCDLLIRHKHRVFKLRALFVVLRAW